MEERFEKLQKVIGLLKEKQNENAEKITLEMGKTITESMSEAGRCGAGIQFCIDQAQEYTADHQLQTSVPHQTKAYVQYGSVGPILNIVPWNYPFRAPFKSFVPNLLHGNPILLKHSPTTPQCGEAIESIFHEAGFDQGEFFLLKITNEQAAKVIADQRVRALKFTGSTRGGKQVAEVAGRHMKKGCFELGGSDPFVVLDGADLPDAVEKGYTARMINSGQLCVSAKRFILHESLYDEFRERLVEMIKAKARLGDPMDEAVTVGPLAVEALTEELRQ